MISNDEVTAFECIRCQTFLTDESLTIAEQRVQMKRHLDAAHPYWDLEDIGASSLTHEANYRQKTRQKAENSYADTTEFSERNQTSFEPLKRSSQRRQLFGILGSTLLFVGVFTPIISLPFVGSMNYFQNGKGDGVIILALALVSIVLTLARKYLGLWITGVGSLAVMVFTFVNFQVRMSQVQAEMETRLAGNPFRGIADVAMQSIQIQWGWAVLIVGATLLIASAAIRDETAT